MGLPVLSHPTFSLVLPSNQQTVTFRPFLVKEEKILLIAQAGGEQADVVRAIKQVIASCITDPSINVEKFTTFDLEYFFIKLRAKSVQNIINLSYKDNEDGKIYDVQVNLDDVEVIRGEPVSNVITVGPTSSIVLKYPEISIMNEMEGIGDIVDFNFAIMQACIDKVEHDGTMYNVSEFTREEVQSFVDGLDVNTYQAIQKFIESMPRVEHTIGYTNSNGKEVKIVLKTLTDFFTLG